MTHAKTLASRIRWLLLGLSLLSWAIGIFYLFNVLWPQWSIFSGKMPHGAGLLGVGAFFTDNQVKYLTVAIVFLGLFFLTQWVFLLPRMGWRPGRGLERTPMSLSILIGAFMAAALTAGLTATVLHPVDAWDTLVYPDGNVGGDESTRHWVFPTILLVFWAVWAILFFVYARDMDHKTWTGRLLRGLFAGSVLELLVSIPAQFLVRREEDCYCVRGSYTGLVLGTTVLLWVFGPGVFLLFWREKSRIQGPSEIRE